MRLIKQLTVAALALLASKGLADPVLPSSDGFYTPPDGYESTTPGTVLRHRAVPNPIPDMDNVEGAFQILYRTTDSLGNATATVTTLIVPMNATNDKLVSYQIAEDAAYIGCAPSYVLQLAPPDFTLQQIINQGWYLSTPDYEGQNSSFAAGVLAGQATLDSIRAVLSTGDFSGIDPGAKIGVWGYSGGSIAAGWAAQLQPQYAPELDLSGVAVGGFVVNLTATVLLTNGGLTAGFIPTGILGLASQYPELQAVLDSQLQPQNETIFTSVLGQCLTADIIEFIGQNIFSYFKDGEDLLYNPIVEEITNNLTMGGSAPKAPMFVYQGEQDQIVPYKGVDEAVSSYCSLGADIQYYKDPTAGHSDLAVDGEPFALSWLADRLNGQSASSGCATYTTTFPVNNNTALPTTNATVTAESIASVATVTATATASSANASNASASLIGSSTALHANASIASITSTGSSTAVSTKASNSGAISRVNIILFTVMFSACFLLSL